MSFTLSLVFCLEAHDIAYTQRALFGRIHKAVLGWLLAHGGIFHRPEYATWPNSKSISQACIFLLQDE